MNKNLTTILEYIKAILLLGLFPTMIYFIGKKSIVWALIILTILIEIGIITIVNIVEGIKNEFKLKEYFQMFGMQKKSK